MDPAGVELTACTMRGPIASVPPFIPATDPRMSARLADHKKKFATSLVGRWSTAQGTFDAAMSEVWEFRADGTLRVTSQSAHSGANCDVYRWESSGPFQIRIGMPAEEGSPDGTGTWKLVTYDFDVLEHDAGQQVVLHEVAEDGFWLSEAPLSLRD